MPSELRNDRDSADIPIGLVRIFPRREHAEGEVWSVDDWVTIGRDKAARIQLHDIEVARRHARLVRDGAALRVIAEADTGPIRIDGVALSSASARISAGSLLRLGDTLLLVVDDPARYRSLPGRPPVELDGAIAPLSAGPTLLAAWREAVEAARAGAPGLLVGERGVGKETTARLIHHAGASPHRPFLSLDPRLIPSEVLEAALFGDEVARDRPLELGPLGRSCGTLYIERIDTLKPELQAKLARALGSSSAPGNALPVSTDRVRVIASSETEAPSLVPELANVFSPFVVRIPPLRARRDDILALAHDRLRRMSPQSTLEAGAAEILATAGWLGNISELHDALDHAAREAAAVGSDSIRVEHLPDALRLGAGAGSETPPSAVVPVELGRGSIYCFGSYELHAKRFELRRGATVVRMQPRVFDLLLYLVVNANRVVTRSELLAGPWRGASVVRSALNQAIMLLRRTLQATDGSSPIKTVRQRGFRLDAAVTVRSDDASNQNWRARERAG